MPRKIKNCFNDTLTFEKMLEAHERAKQGKFNRYEVLNFELNLEPNIVNLVEQVRNKSYKMGFTSYFTLLFFIFKPVLNDYIIQLLLIGHYDIITIMDIIKYC